MAQMRERGYGEKYRDCDGLIYLIGLVFSRNHRNLLGIRAESI